MWRFRQARRLPLLSVLAVGLAKVAGNCVWEFGNMPNGNTFGGGKQHGTVKPATMGAFAGPVRRNPSC